MKKLTTEQFIERAKLIHGDRYDYSKVEYEKASLKVNIICPIHKEFTQTANSHLSGNGCSKCGLENTRQSKLLSIFTVKNQFNEVHKNKYRYDWSTYINNKTKIKIICPIHGEFWQKPIDHKKGQGCPKCAGKIKLTTQEFIERGILAHKNKYNYSKVEYINNSTKVIIICSIHGIFHQTPNCHMKGRGCPKCGFEITLQSKLLPINTIKERFEKVHGEKYSYDWPTYKNNSTKMKMICSVHGKFYQTPNNHKSGNGCPNCKSSKGETKIREFLEKNKIEFIQEKRFNCCRYKNPLPFDFYLPEKNICIEFDGIQHFKFIYSIHKTIDNFKLYQLKDKIKNNYCFVEKIKLLRINYTEFKNIENILYNSLK